MGPSASAGEVLVPDSTSLTNDQWSLELRKAAAPAAGSNNFTFSDIDTGAEAKSALMATAGAWDPNANTTRKVLALGNDLEVISGKPIGLAAVSDDIHLVSPRLGVISYLRDYGDGIIPLSTVGVENYFAKRCVVGVRPLNVTGLDSASFSAVIATSTYPRYGNTVILNRIPPMTFTDEAGTASTAVYAITSILPGNFLTITSASGNLVSFYRPPGVGGADGAITSPVNLTMGGYNLANTYGLMRVSVFLRFTAGTASSQVEITLRDSIAGANLLSGNPIMRYYLPAQTGAVTWAHRDLFLVADDRRNWGLAIQASATSSIGVTLDTFVIQFINPHWQVGAT